MAPPPTFRYLEVLDIATCRVVFGRSVWRIGGKFIVNIGIDWDAESFAIAVELYLDVSRYVYIIP